jgi:putative nucleotidyltransferase with HDIG domain
VALVGPGKAKDAVTPRFTQRDSVFRRLLVGVVLFLVFWAVLYGNVLPDRVVLEVGEASPSDVPVPRETVNRLETERLRKEAADAIPDVYHEDSSALGEALEEIKAAFAGVEAILADVELGEEAKLIALQEGWGSHFPEDTLASLALVSPQELAEARVAMEALVTTLMVSGIKPDTLENYRRQVDMETEAMALPGELKQFSAWVAKSSLRANLLYNAQETEARRQAAIEQVLPVKLARGEVIVRKGQKVTEDHMALLEDLGLVHSGPDISDLVGSGLLSGILVGSVALYLRLFNRDVSESESRLVLLGLMAAVTLLIAQVFQPISGFLAPVAAGTMLMATLIEPRLAVVSGVILSVMVSVMNGWDMRFFLAGTVGGLMGVLGVSRVGQRSDFMRAGFLVSSAVVAVVVTSHLIMGASLSDLASWRTLLWGALNGIVSAILTMGCLPYLEILFQVMTPMKLIELSNPNRPLLRRLLMEAPGTYHHSVMVANLAEAATEAVGGDSLLARVGSYYHDVGKVKRPYFFIDNQFGLENPHDRLSPSLSTLIVTSHVKDGLELAREHKVPEPVQEFIRSHHGTSLVSYFYSRAAEEGKCEGVPESDFRYDGPKPSTRETAIVMLADGVEAAVRSLTKPTPARVEGVVKKIIKERLYDGQLDHSDLTFKDLDAIGDAFVKALSGMFHPRIEYPESVLREMERQKNGAKISAHGQG